VVGSIGKNMPATPNPNDIHPIIIKNIFIAPQKYKYICIFVILN
jgi:hypothetical protein